MQVSAGNVTDLKNQAEAFTSYVCTTLKPELENATENMVTLKDDVNTIRSSTATFDGRLGLVEGLTAQNNEDLEESRVQYVALHKHVYGPLQQKVDTVAIQNIQGITALQKELASVHAKEATVPQDLSINKLMVTGTDGIIDFGSTVTTKIKLYGNDYNFGIQHNTLMYRSGGRHTWYTGGAHSTLENNAGGGRLTMSLDAVGNMYTTGIIQSNVGYNCKSGISGGLQGNRFNISWSGSAANLWIDNSNRGTLSVSSDYRLKKQVLNQEAGLSKVLNLRPVTYKIRDFDIFKDSDDLNHGFIAHEVQEAGIPDGATGQKDGIDSNGKPEIQNICIVPIVSVVTKAVQELHTMVLQLQEENAILKSMMSTLYADYLSRQ